MEIGVESPKEWRGTNFVESLRHFGVKIEAGTSQKKAPLIIASFLSPKAYLGKIQISPKEARQLQAAISKSSEATLVSFGSPFVMSQLKGYSAGLCAFSEMEASQHAAAQALTGKIDVVGKLPVNLKASG
jgi:hypothetical protein